MAETKDLGRFFGHTIRVKPGTALWHTARTQETDKPFRAADSKVLRIWPTTWALVLGRWQDSGITDEREALYAATHIPGLDGHLGAGGWVVDTDDEGNLRPAYGSA